MTKRQRKKQAKKYLADNIVIYMNDDKVFERLTWEKIKVKIRFGKRRKETTE
jgi:hypothetical protein